MKTMNEPGFFRKTRLSSFFGLLPSHGPEEVSLREGARLHIEPPRPMCVDPYSAAGYQYRFHAEGESTHSRNPSQESKWGLRFGIHRGGLVSRDSAPAAFKYGSFTECLEELKKHLEFYRTIGCYIWFAEAIAPAGTVHKLVDGAPYAS